MKAGPARVELTPSQKIGTGAAVAQEDAHQDSSRAPENQPQSQILARDTFILLFQKFASSICFGPGPDTSASQFSRAGPFSLEIFLQLVQPHWRTGEHKCFKAFFMRVGFDSSAARVTFLHWSPTGSPALWALVQKSRTPYDRVHKMNLFEVIAAQHNASY